MITLLLAAFTRWLTRLTSLSSWPGVSLLGGETFHGTHLLQITISPAQIAANTTAEQSFAIPVLPIPAQLLNSAVVEICKPSAQAGLGIANQRVIDSTHVGITFINATAAAITPAANEVYNLAVDW